MAGLLPSSKRAAPESRRNCGHASEVLQLPALLQLRPPACCTRLWIPPQILEVSLIDPMVAVPGRRGQRRGLRRSERGARPTASDLTRGPSSCALSALVLFACALSCIGRAETKRARADCAALFVDLPLGQARSVWLRSSSCFDSALSKTFRDDSETRVSCRNRLETFGEPRFPRGPMRFRPEVALAQGCFAYVSLLLSLALCDTEKPVFANESANGTGSDTSRGLRHAVEGEGRRGKERREEICGVERSKREWRH